MRVKVQLKGNYDPNAILVTAIRGGHPAVRYLTASVVLHAVAVSGLLSLQSPAQPLLRQSATLRPTEIKIGDRLYFIHQLPPHPAQQRAAVVKRAAPRRRARARREPPAQPKLAKSDQPAPPKPAPKVFAPPQVVRDPARLQTLIQPQSPPDLVPPEVKLPNLEVWTAKLQIPKIPKPFVVPGRTRQAPQAPAPLPAPLPPLVAQTQAPKVPARLTLLPPPVAAPPQPVQTAPPVPSRGDPVSVVSLSAHPVPPSSTIRVPPGNVVGLTSSSGTKSGNQITPESGAPGGTAPSPAGGGNTSAAGSGTDQDGPSTGGISLTGTESASAGTITGEPRPGADVSTAGSSTSGIQTVVVNQPATGNFDLVVVQASPLDMFPEGKGLLSGRPIYTVYVAANGAEWPFYFCVPAGKAAPPPPRNTQIVELTAPAPVRAPYPIHLVLPAIKLPAGQKYALIHGYVTESGKFQELRVVNDVPAAIQQALLTSLGQWEFRPATRDGVPVKVEFLLSVLAPRA
jgi:hypothetical protein